MKTGFTKAWRKELCSDIWRMPPLYQRVFYYLRQKATWQSITFPTREKFGIALNPGQLITSLSNIAEGVAWHDYGVKRVPNKKTIKDILVWLDGNDMITAVSNRLGTFIIIINWDTYNTLETEKVTQNNHEFETINKRLLDTLKELEEVKKKLKKKSKEKDLKPFVEKPEIPFKEIIEYLNLKTDKRYQHTTPKTQNFIKARWSEGFKSLDDYKHVIDVKCHKWLNTEDEKFLRPETLFGTKFEGYLNERIIENSQSPQVPKATTVYQADMLQKEAVNQEYLRQRRQNEESNSRHQDVVDIENSPRSINQTD